MAKEIPLPNETFDRKKTLSKLQYSPYLTKEKDDIYFDKRTSLIPTWNKAETDKVYIYKIDYL